MRDVVAVRRIECASLIVSCRWFVMPTMSPSAGHFGSRVTAHRGQVLVVSYLLVEPAAAVGLGPKSHTTDSLASLPPSVLVRHRAKPAIRAFTYQTL